MHARAFVWMLQRTFLKEGKRSPPPHHAIPPHRKSIAGNFVVFDARDFDRAIPLPRYVANGDKFGRKYPPKKLEYFRPPRSPVIISVAVVFGAEVAVERQRREKQRQERERGGE
jgi:hypothetical protein